MGVARSGVSTARYLELAACVAWAMELRGDCALRRPSVSMNEPHAAVSLEMVDRLCAACASMDTYMDGYCQPDVKSSSRDRGRMPHERHT